MKSLLRFRDTALCQSFATKAVITMLLTAWWLYGPVVGYSPAGSGTIQEHILWMVSHANIWHLLGNLWVLWLLKGKMHIAESVIISFLCSWIPVFGIWDIGDTVGFSGVLCATIGIRWGEWCKSCGTMSAYGTFCKKVLPFVAVGALVPGINWCIHLYCILAGLIYGRFR